MVSYVIDFALIAFIITYYFRRERRRFFREFFQNDYKNTNALQQLCTFTFMIIINLSIDNDLSFIEGGHTQQTSKS